MPDSHHRTLEALDAVRRLVDQLHDDDIAERWWGRSFELPEGVRVEVRTMGNNPERVRDLLVTGEFSVEALRSVALSERYVDQADVWDLELAALDGHAPERGARVDSGEQAGATNRFIIGPDVRRAASLPTAQGPVIGELVPVGRFDVSGMLIDRIVTRLALLRSGRHDIENLLLLRPIDDATAMFGAPPEFLPVFGLMVDGAVVGCSVDAEEVGTIDPKLLVYDLNSNGAFPADNQYVLATLLDRMINNRWPVGEAPDAAIAVAADLGLELRDGVADLGLAYGIKRRKPLVTTERYTWRNDSSGNGVMAPPESWGAATVRRPTSVEGALTKASQLVDAAPAAALYCAHEALVLANRSHDGVAIGAAYAAMTAPLRALGRPRVADRAKTLAAVAGVS